MDATAFGKEAFGLGKRLFSREHRQAERRRLICVGLRGRFSGQVEGVAPLEEK